MAAVNGPPVCHIQRGLDHERNKNKKEGGGGVVWLALPICLIRRKKPTEKLTGSGKLKLATGPVASSFKGDRKLRESKMATKTRYSSSQSGR